jgi:hypothetical protein
MMKYSGTPSRLGTGVPSFPFGPLGQDFVVVLVVLVHLRHGDRDRRVRRHHDLFGIEGVVVVDIAPVDRTRRYVTLLERRGQPLQCYDCGLAHLRVVRLPLAVKRNDRIAAIRLKGNYSRPARRSP